MVAVSIVEAVVGRLAGLAERAAESVAWVIAIDSDPLLASLRATPEFKEIRATGLECQNTFLSQRGQEPRR